MKINNDTIIKDDDPRIREKSVDVPVPLNEEDRQLMEDMLTYVKNSTIEEIAEKENLKPAVGISAIQVAVPRKLVAVVLRDEEGNIEREYALANPKVLSSSIEQAYIGSGEGCLSVPEDHEGYVPRSRRIKVRAYDCLKNEEVTFRVSDYPAIVLQHEFDHLKGILYYDHIRKDDPFHEPEGAFCIE